MKNTIVFCILIILTGLFIAIGPFYLFPSSCGSCCSNPVCFWSIKFMLAVGMIITALGIFCIVYNDPKIQFGMTIGILLTGIISFLALQIIIGGCETKSMNCNLVVIPILTGLSVLAIIISGIRLLSLRKKIK